MAGPVGARDLVYRSLPGGGTIGCGFIAKPDPAAVQTEFRKTHEYSLLVVLAGGGTYRDDAVVRPLRAGDAVHRLPGRHHWTIPAADGAWREFFLLLPASWPAALTASGVALDPPVWRIGLDRRLITDLTAFLPALRAADDRGMPALAIAMAAWIGRAWAAQRAGGGEDVRFDRACLELARDPSAPRPPTAVARELGMEYRTFRRWFTRLAGCAPAAYRLRSRLDHARTLLASTDLAIPDIASASGFVDRHAFTRQFAAKMGVSPAAFRRQHG